MEEAKFKDMREYTEAVNLQEECIKFLKLRHVNGIIFKNII